MKKHKWPSLLAVLLAAAVLAAGCAPVPSTSGQSPSQSTGSDVEIPQAQYKEEDIDDSYDEASATKISLSGSTAAVEGSGASVSGSKVTIRAAGVYVVSGSLSDGQILISAGDKDKVHLVLKGASITSTTSAPIYNRQSDKLIITLAEGTQNTVTDTAGHAYEDAEAEEPDAAIFSKTDLSINGKGSLTVNGNFRNGIGTKDDLFIANGGYVVTAANDGLRGRDSITVLDSSFQITSTGDGIKSNNDEDAQKGWILLSGGSYQITAGNDGIQAETTLSISNGDFQITTNGGSAGVVKASNQGRPGMGQAPQQQTTQQSSESYKGLKSGTGLTIGGGTFTIDSADDAVHSNGVVAVNGGSFTISTGDDGFHADAELNITDGSIEILTSYEGLEGSNITISGGTISLIASDDGLNAAGGSDEESATGAFGRDQFASSGNHTIRILGGNLTVNANGDGIDSNGSIEMSGGMVTVYGPTNSGNGALDYDGTFHQTGGVLIAAGSSGMAQAPSESSTQPSLMVYFTTAQAAGTQLELTSGGTSILTVAPLKPFQTLVVSTPELVQGQAYTLSANGSKVMEVTLSGVVTAVSDTGEAVTGGMGGPGGGMGRPNMGQRPEGNMGQRPGGQQPPAQ